MGIPGGAFIFVSFTEKKMELSGMGTSLKEVAFQDTSTTTFRLVCELHATEIVIVNFHLDTRATAILT